MRVITKEKYFELLSLGIACVATYSKHIEEEQNYIKELVRDSWSAESELEWRGGEPTDWLNRFDIFLTVVEESSTSCDSGCNEYDDRGSVCEKV